MVNIENQLKQNLSVVEFLGLILTAPKDLSGTGPYILVPAGVLNAASRNTTETINYCKEHELIEVKPLGSKCYEFHITAKGAAFHRSQKIKEKYSRKD